MWDLQLQEHETCISHLAGDDAGQVLCEPTPTKVELCSRRRLAVFKSLRGGEVSRDGDAKVSGWLHRFECQCKEAMAGRKGDI